MSRTKNLDHFHGNLRNPLTSSTLGLDSNHPKVHWLKTITMYSRVCRTDGGWVACSDPAGLDPRLPLESRSAPYTPLLLLRTIAALGQKHKRLRRKTQYLPAFKINFYWSIAALQYCVSFCCTAKQISHMCAYIKLPRWLSGKEFACDEGDKGFNPWVGKIRWRRKCNPLHYSCLENSMDGGAWQATVHEVVKSWTT